MERPRIRRPDPASSEEALIGAMREAADLERCVSAFGTALHRIIGGGICFINLYDAVHDVLRCVDVMLPPALEHMRATYVNFVFPRGSDAFRSYEERATIFVRQADKERCSPNFQVAFERYRLREIVIVPLVPFDGHPVCAGSLTLMLPEWEISAAKLDEVRHWIRDKAMLLQLHMSVRVLGDRMIGLRDVENEIDNMLEFVAETSNLTRVEEICPSVLRELLVRFDHDLGAIWMVADDHLRCVASLAAQDIPWFDAWLAACGDYRFSLTDARDGAVSYVYSTGQSLVFEEIPAIKKLSMASKDSRLLEIAEGVMSLSLHPIRRHGRPSGVLAIYSLRRTSPLTEVQRERIGHWADFLGAVLESATTYEILEKRSRELSDSNAELAATLTSLHQTQEALVQSKKLSALGAIVVAVAHELNTPIGNAVTITTTVEDEIQSFEEQMRAGLRKSTLERFIHDAKHATGLVSHNLDRAVRLIRDFKNIAVDTGNARRQRFDPHQAIEEVVIELKPEWRQYPVDIVVSPATGAICDSYRSSFCQVVANLLVNAYTHAFIGRSAGKIWIHLETGDNQNLCLRVRDDGIGIPEKQLECIFDPFFTSRLGKGNSGLGLYVTYNIVTSVLGGQIHAESKAGEGTCFTVTFPVCAPKSAGDFS